MTEKTRKTRVPTYLKEFSCIGSPCEDNCCIGWDVDFDKKSFQKYRKVKDGELGQLFKSCVMENPDSFSDEVDYATVKLRKNKVCPFLNEQHLCKIQARFGEAHLSNVCATYPRYTNTIDGVFEHSATVSCPEAARLILMNPQGIRFVEGEENASNRYILTYGVNTQERGNPLRVSNLLALRQFSIDLLQQREIPLWQRLLLLGGFFEKLGKAEKSRKKTDVSAMISEFKAELQSGGSRGVQWDKAPNPAGQLALLKEITKSLKVFTEIDSQRYIEFTQEFIQGLRPNGAGKSKDEGLRLAQAYGEIYHPFMETHEYLLENYLVNFVFKDLFPAAEGADTFDAFMMLVIRYALIKLHLTGIGAHRGALTEETVVGFIQAFSKTVEHHKTYLESIAEHMSAMQYNTMEYMEMLIRE